MTLTPELLRVAAARAEKYRTGFGEVFFTSKAAEKWLAELNSGTIIPAKYLGYG